ncbi:MAG: hypothetical protein DRP45_08720 [Candidatus Zixiibacteriota bacterium]|nr:MAG: hypothetical protein DRP45_08720 [candidate division Zixibacteria bacterium]
MKVKATRKGYWDLKIREPGDVFDMGIKGKLPSWVIKVGGGRRKPEETTASDTESTSGSGSGGAPQFD